MYQLAVCDDDQNMLKVISGIIDLCLEADHHLLMFSSSEELLSYINNKENPPVQILIMDILLDGENGIDLSGKIKSQSPEIKIIFLTGYPEYSQWSYDVDHIWFLLKPVEKSLMEKALKRAIEEIEGDEKDFLMVEKRGELIRVPYKEILYLSSDLRKINIHLMDGSILEYYGKLDAEEERLPESFIRCHKSLLVNISLVQVFKGKELILKDGQGNLYHIPISNSYALNIKDAILEYSSGKIRSRLIR